MATEPRRPFHIVWLVGLSASVYAANLAVVSTLQAAADQQVASQAAPAAAALEALQAHDAIVARQIEQAAANLEAGTKLYSQAGTTLADLERSLAGLGKSAGTLRALPAIPVVRGAAAAPPVVHATTGASGARP